MNEQQELVSDILARLDEESHNLMISENRVTRQLSEREKTIYSAALMRAVGVSPSLTPIFSLFQPVVTYYSPTTAVDEYCRLYLGLFFFENSLNDDNRASMLTHEALHIVLDNFNQANRRITNFADDMVINQLLARSPKYFMPCNQNVVDRVHDMTPFIMPRTFTTEKYPKGLPEHESQEFYYRVIVDEMNNMQDMDSNTSGNNNQQSESDSGSGSQQNNQQGGQKDDNKNGSEGQKDNDSSSGKDNKDGSKGQEGNNPNTQNGGGQKGSNFQHNKNTGCHVASNQEKASADGQGVSKADEVNITIAKQNTLSRAKNGSGLDGASVGSGDSLDSFLVSALHPPTLNWKQLLKHSIQNSYNTMVAGSEDWTYSRPNRRSNSHVGQLIKSGFVSYEPTVLVGLDVSGSMGKEQLDDALSEINGLLKTLHTRVTIVSVDVDIVESNTVSNIQSLKLKHGGGTEMNAFATYVRNLPAKKQPNISILLTDGILWDGDWDDMAKTYPAKGLHYIIRVVKDGSPDIPDGFLKSRQNVMVLTLPDKE